MKEVFGKSTVTATLLLFTVLLFCILTGFFLNNDFWQDEIYTIEHFIFLSWGTVVTDYHSTNNHIFFNGLVKLFAQKMGVNKVVTALEYPWLLRVIPYLFSILSLLVFYRGTKKHYGKAFALTNISIFCTSIVLIDFGAQLRGYSLSILLTILQYFVFLDIVKENKKKLAPVRLFCITALSLLCLPTNIYIVFAYLLFCLMVLLIPSTATYFFRKRVKKSNFIWIAVFMLGATIVVMCYYKWLLQMQPENPLIASFKMFTLKNLRQALAIFFHFTGYRFYFLLFLIVWLVFYFKKLNRSFYSGLLLPTFLFFIPFIAFYIHGAVIIQRTFLSVLPFFVLVIATSVEEVHETLKFKNLRNYFYSANIICLAVSFFMLLKNSAKFNQDSVHKHDLINHYYLVNFNASKVTAAASGLIKMKAPLFVWDDYGKTGIEYYLNRYGVPFNWYNDTVILKPSMIILTNNKKEFEKKLYHDNISFNKIFSSADQYNLYLLY